MKITLIYGPSSSGKTEKILSELEKVHNENPFSYYFVGPSGDNVRHLRESFISRVKTIPSSRFLAMDQFAVNLFKELVPSSYHIQDYIIRLEIGNILEKLGKGELVDSTMFVDYVLEMVHDVKEQGGFSEIFAENDEVVDTLKDIYDALEKRFAGNMIFDTFDAYTRIEEHTEKMRKGEFGKYLFIDGFHDFSPAIARFFNTVIPLFEDVFITIPDDPGREELYSSASSIRGFIEALKDKYSDTQTQRLYLRESHYPEPLKHFLGNLFSERKKGGICQNVSATVFPDIFSEVDLVARNVKKLLVGGYAPGDIALVASDFQLYDRLLSQKLSEYGVPSRSEGDEPLLSSLSIRKLILPLETAVLGFPPDKLVAMGDNGYGGDVDAKFLESVVTMSRIIYDRSHIRLRLDDRYRTWMERLDKFVEFTDRRRKAILALAEDELESSPAAELGETIRRVREDLVPAIKEIFRKLEIFKSMRKRPVEEFGNMFAGWERDLNLTDSYRKLEESDEDNGELLALKRFFEWVIPELERILLFMGKREMSPQEYYSYLMLMLREESYAASRSIANRVEIQSLLRTRFSKKKVKIFLGFVDGAYPYVKLNPLYSFTQYSEVRPKDLLLTEEKHQRLNLYLAITSTREMIGFTFPDSTIDGEPILPSPYLKDILESSGVSVERMGLVSGRRQGLIPSLKDAMSEQELRISAAKFYGKDFWTELRERFDLSALELSLAEFNSDPGWTVLDLGRLKNRVGDTFSFSRLKSYSDCPFSFFLSYVIGLDRKSDYIFELTPLEEGNVYHAVLRDYFSGNTQEWEEALKENLTKHIMHDSTVVFKFEYARLREVLQEYVTIREAKRPRLMDGEYFPFEFEVSFGLGGRPGIELVPGVFLRGKIDRLDIDEDTDTLYLIDYKRGKSGDKEQLLLYSIAADRLYTERGYTVAGGVFKSLTGTTINSAAFKTEIVDGERIWRFAGDRKNEPGRSESQLLEWVKGVTDSLYSGDFTPVCLSASNKCFQCPFKKMKRVATWRDGGELDEE